MVRRTHAGLLSAAVILLVASPALVFADVPQIMDLAAHSIIDCGVPLGGRGFLLIITVKHADPTTSHYVDKVEIMKGKSVESIGLQPQSDETFTVTATLCEGRDYQVGQKLPAQARAHCTIHGWGAWSSSISIPEFASSAFVCLITVILAWSLASFRRSGLGLSHLKGVK